MKRALILSGLAALAAVWFGPLPALAKTSFAAHMAIHVSVVAIAAPLISAGLVLTNLCERRIFSAVLSPVPASLLEFVVVWGWHVPALHHFARQSVSGFSAEQFSFLLTATLLWTSALRRSTASRDARGAGVIALLLTSMHMVLLGTLLTLASRPLYHSSALTSEAMSDQQLGGILMLAGAGLPYLAGGLWLVLGMLDGGQHDRADVSPALGGSRPRKFR